MTLKTALVSCCSCDTKYMSYINVTADMQTKQEPQAGPICANSHVGWAALYIASYIYICTSCPSLDVHIPSEVLLIWEIS